MEWQPIETAPRDGTDVDLWVEVSGVPEDTAWGESRRVTNCYFENGDWLEFTCLRCSTGSGLVEDQYSRATHWMPLPPAPGRELR